jgi:hypothetical protein
VDEWMVGVCCCASDLGCIFQPLYARPSLDLKPADGLYVLHFILAWLVVNGFR